MAGVILTLILCLSFTRVPWRLYGWLACKDRPLPESADLIVVLGGGGIPSKSGLMRTYQGARAAGFYTNAGVIVALPMEEGGGVPSVVKMKEELILRGIEPARIRMETRGRSTREQAVNIHDMYRASAATAAVVVVTCPEHVRRSVLSFRKAGFTNTYGMAAFDEPVAADLTMEQERAGNHWIPPPDVGGNLMIRYVMWTHLHYLTDFAREGAALLYYKWHGWI